MIFRIIFILLVCLKLQPHLTKNINKQFSRPKVKYLVYGHNVSNVFRSISFMTTSLWKIVKCLPFSGHCYFNLWNKCLLRIQHKGRGFCWITIVTHCRKTQTFNHCWRNLDPPSATLAQHLANFGRMPRVCWDQVMFTSR